MYRIISLNQNFTYLEPAVVFYRSIQSALPEESRVSPPRVWDPAARFPRWFLCLDEQNRIRGGYALAWGGPEGRPDLSPRVTGLYPDGREGNPALTARLLEHAREEAASLGLDFLFYATDQSNFGDLSGWRLITTLPHKSTSAVYVFGAVAPKYRILEKMSDFFTARLESYESQMIKYGRDEIYRQFAALIPDDCREMLDLGCGTGLELEFIFKRLPDVQVLGIDLTRGMLEHLASKFPGKNIRVICDDYFSVDLGQEHLDTAIAYQTLHHYTPARKAGLYRKILAALKPGGIYLEADYMVFDRTVEEMLADENVRRRRELNLSEADFFHFDTPCAVETQIGLLQQAGFSAVEEVLRQDYTVILRAVKPGPR